MELTTELKTALWKIANLAIDCKEDKLTGIEFELMAFDILNNVKPINATSELLERLNELTNCIQGMSNGRVILTIPIELSQKIGETIQKATL